MRKISVCVLFGGISPEHPVSLRSAESVLNQMDPEKYNLFPVGITREGKWLLYGGTDYSLLPDGSWERHPDNCEATISPIRGQGLLQFRDGAVTSSWIDVVFPVLHGENGEDGAMQGLLQMAGIAYVGSHVATSAVAMDKTLTKLVMDRAGIPQAKWLLVRASDLASNMEGAVRAVEERFSYPCFVKPAGTGSSVGVSKAKDRESLEKALLCAGQYDEKILVEEFIHGREIEVAVMGNRNPVASVCGEIDSGAEFYDYEAKYVSDTSVAYIPARISQSVAEQVRELAVKAYREMDCKGLSRVDFFVTYADDRIVFNEINTLPGFTSISMYPKLFAASGIAYSDLIDKLLQLALEA
ncbi:MAG: D-alanine--D-alanine ligase [Oscillospiraceae bacterium]|nr:D-alanine--D-alanine ligase [Oscillospiraceae bacterium]